MEHISNSLKKYSQSKQQLVELDKIRAEIFNSTGINPVSLKIKNDTLTIKVNNQYEALEISNKREIIMSKLTSIQHIKVSLTT